MAATVPVGEPITVEHYEPEIIETRQIVQPVVQEQKKVYRESQMIYEVSPKLVKRKFYDFDGEEVIEQYVESLPRIHQDAFKLVCISALIKCFVLNVS
jgi:hypothetical protein